MKHDNGNNRGTLVDTVYHRIYDDIRKRYFNPGQKLIIRELSERYGLSQTPIKQALNRLVADKMVENIPRYGIYVRRITWRQIVEVMQARLMVETFCVPAVLDNAHSPEFMRKMEETVIKYADLQNWNNYEDLYPQHIRLDVQFHQEFVRCCNNASIIGYYNELVSPIYLNYFYYGKRMNRLWKSCEEHRVIFNAITAGDAEALRAAIMLHNQNASADNQQIVMNEESQYVETDM